MTGVELVAVFVSLAAVLAYVNARALRLPSAIGLMALALFVSFAVVGLGKYGIIDASRVQGLVARADFSDALMHGALGLLLFAGALHVDIVDLVAQRSSIATLALGSTLLSTAIVGAATFVLLRSLGHDIDLADAFLFGALISPTDPIAVLGILRSAKAPTELAVQISGESLFNDGIGVVLFMTISEASRSGHVTGTGMALLFARETLGGAAFGLALGYLGFRLLRSIDDYSVEVLITLAVALGGYALGERLHVSAPIAAVVAGLIVGNQGRRLAMSKLTREHVDVFWKLVDEILNAILFLALGLEATRLTVGPGMLLAAGLVVLIVLGARLISVAIPVSLLRMRSKFPPHAVKILTWGGLRGGISVALALSLRNGLFGDRIVLLTYAVVACSILVQGLSLGRVVRHLGSGA